MLPSNYILALNILKEGLIQFHTDLSDSPAYPTHIYTIANLHLMFPGVVSIHVGAGAAFTPVASFHTSELPSFVKRIYRVQSKVLN